MKIFKAIARGLRFFMTSSEKRRKDKFFEEMRDWGKPTHSEEMQDKLEPIPMPCPMHEDYDDVEKDK